MQIRTVPGQTIEGIREDLQRVLDDIKVDYPPFDCAMTIPADSPGDLQFVAPSEMPRNHPPVAALAEGQRLASGRDPLIGGGLRIGNFGDGNILAAAGIPAVQYGPGDVRIYEEWPCADERVEFRELVETARAMAYAIARCCGRAALCLAQIVHKPA